MRKALQKKREPLSSRSVSSISPSAIHDVIEWLASDECHDVDDAGLIAGLGRQLQAAGTSAMPDKIAEDFQWSEQHVPIGVA